MKGLVASVNCVVLVGVNGQTNEAYGNGDTLVSQGINDAIEATVSANPDKFKEEDWLEISDWRGEMTAQDPNGQHNFTVLYKSPEYPDGIWVGDGIHQSPEGSKFYANQVHETLSTECFPT
jgi:hypothetical protein